MAAIPAREPAICRRGIAGNGRSGSANRAGAGLPVRIVAENGEGSARRGASGDFLAHSVGECGSFCDLPVPARTAGRIAGCGPGGISYSGALQQFSGNGGPFGGSADGMGSFRRKSPGTCNTGQTLT